MVHRRGQSNSEEKGCIVIKGRLEFPDIAVKAKVFYTMRLFKEAVERSFVLLKRGLKEREIAKRITRYVSNAHYAYSALQRAKMYKNQSKLRLRKPQLYSIGKACENGNRNIRFISTDKVLIKIPHANGRHEWAECKAKFGKKHLPVIEELINADFPYSVGVVLNNGKFHLHVTVPLEIVIKHDNHSKVTKKNKYIAGFDLNSDRINMVIINEHGEILDVKNRHFPEITQPGFPKDKARDIILKALSELIDYAVYHNVRYFVFEKLANVKRKKTIDKNANRKIARFSYRILLNHAKTMVKKRRGIFVQVNPAYASIDAIPLSKRLGLDVHTTSAYLLALRYLNLRILTNAYEK